MPAYSSLWRAEREEEGEGRPFLRMVALSVSSSSTCCSIRIMPVQPVQHGTTSPTLKERSAPRPRPCPRSRPLPDPITPHGFHGGRWFKAPSPVSFVPSLPPSRNTLLPTVVITTSKGTSTSTSTSTTVTITHFTTTNLTSLPGPAGLLVLAQPHCIPLLAKPSSPSSTSTSPLPLSPKILPSSPQTPLPPLSRFPPVFSAPLLPDYTLHSVFPLHSLISPWSSAVLFILLSHVTLLPPFSASASWRTHQTVLLLVEA